MDHGNEPHSDPLDELRELANGEKIGRIIDAWQVDRSMSVALSNRVDELQAKLESMTKDRDEWRSTYENVSPDVMQKMSELQAKLDASESYNSALRTERTELQAKLEVSMKCIDKLLGDVVELQFKLDKDSAGDKARRSRAHGCGSE